LKYDFRKLPTTADNMLKELDIKEIIKSIRRRENKQREMGKGKRLF